jgi:hypothetical protein
MAKPVIGFIGLGDQELSLATAIAEAGPIGINLRMDEIRKGNGENTTMPVL